MGGEGADEQETQGERKRVCVVGRSLMRLNCNWTGSQVVAQVHWPKAASDMAGHRAQCSSAAVDCGLFLVMINVY